MVVVDIIMVPRQQVLWPKVILWLAADSVNVSLRRHVPYHPQLNARPLMAERSPIVECEDIPLDEARRMSRGPRMTPQLNRAIQEKIESLSTTAIRLTFPESMSTTTTKLRILRARQGGESHHVRSHRH